MTGRAAMTGTGSAATDSVATLEPMITDQAQAYQRLRAHLSELRLTAAAGSLTAVLDAARDEQLSPITVLERLLGIEVDAAAGCSANVRAAHPALSQNNRRTRSRSCTGRPAIGASSRWRR